MMNPSRSPVTSETSPEWFTVDREGLRQLVQRKGFAFILTELYQNAADQPGVTRIEVRLRPADDPKRYILEVEDDDPQGFADLRHAWTVFAPSEKKRNPEQAGRFNLGEKIVLALADSATIATTTGTVAFTRNGRQITTDGRATGSLFAAVLPLMPAEAEDALRTFRTVLPKPGVRVTVNGEPLPARTPVRSVDSSLPTEIADETGVLRRRLRKTTIGIYQPLPGEPASLYELGIPVVATGDRWSYDVRQKVPLTIDRDNVPPSFLEAIRTAVLNTTHDLLTRDDTTTVWAEEAVANPQAAPEAVTAYMAQRFGEKRVAFDPSDPEANKRAMAEGHTIVYGASLSKGAWANVRRSEAILPAGQVTPTPRPGAGDDGNIVKYVAPERITPGMRRIEWFAREIGQRLLQADITVKFAAEVTWPYAATYARLGGGRFGELTFNVGRLGYAWFTNGLDAAVLALLIHELAHHYSGDHLSHEYYDALASLGARLSRLALSNPDLFTETAPTAPLDKFQFHGCSSVPYSRLHNPA